MTNRSRKDIARDHAAKVLALHGKTYDELQKIIWKGWGCPGVVGLRGIFTDREIIDGLCNHPCRDDWPKYFRKWVCVTGQVISLDGSSRLSMRIRRSE